MISGSKIYLPWDCVHETVFLILNRESRLRKLAVSEINLQDFQHYLRQYERINLTRPKKSLQATGLKES